MMYANHVARSRKHISLSTCNDNRMECIPVCVEAPTANSERTATVAGDSEHRLSQAVLEQLHNIFLSLSRCVDLITDVSLLHGRSAQAHWARTITNARAVQNDADTLNMTNG